MLTASYVGLVNNDTPASLMPGPTLSTTATAASNVGSYTITVGGPSYPDYTISYITGTLNVTPVSLTITADNKSKVYGDPLPQLTFSVAGFVNGNTAVQTPPTLITTASPSSPVTSYSITASGAVDPNYTISYVSGALTVTQRPVTGSFTASDKVYDGSTTATITNHLLSGILGTDAVSLYGGTATFVDKNVGAGKTVTGTGFTLSGTAAGNYSLASTTLSTKASITPKPLTITAAGISKAYDTTPVAQVALSDNRVSGDIFTDSYAGATFAQANIGTAIPINVTGISISGTDATNYTFNTTATTAANITPAGTVTALASALSSGVSPVTIKLTATVSSTVAPVGNVTFTDGPGGTLLGTVNLAGSGPASAPAVLTIPASTLTVGSHVIVATYNPSLNFGASNSGTHTAPAATITNPTSGTVQAVGQLAYSATFSVPTSSAPQWIFQSFDTTVIAGGASGNATIANAGVYGITLTSDDGLGGVAITTVAPSGTTTAPAYAVVYDPSAGFVTGGGWIMVQPGSSAQFPGATGKGNFGFVSQYKKGQSTPTGETQFQFQAGNLDFHSLTYQWLVVSGPLAQYKGTGTINGTGSYGFLLTGRQGGKTTTDGFRIQITDPTTNAVIFDNLMGADSSITSANVQTLGGGSVTIHAN
jgi:hypothetical protein